ncbi:unnamed protein product [Strongylus vulgaris]|uniref:Uncharacterized protein n=1 Tax=Strongylus vulgaris TaxID=40348 RepID=A0A3P7JN80_STRVU|nr:unnamed protein product [Strongylus vulgaris]
MFLYLFTILLVLNTFTQDAVMAAGPCVDILPQPACQQVKNKGNCQRMHIMQNILSGALAVILWWLTINDLKHCLEMHFNDRADDRPRDYTVSIFESKKTFEVPFIE